jgi:hypothetical protein
VKINQGIPGMHNLLAVVVLLPGFARTASGYLYDRHQKYKKEASEKGYKEGQEKK